MKTIIDNNTRDELIARIRTLKEYSASRWGKMSVIQMLKHCIQWEEMVFGKKKYKRMLLGRIFGKMALKDMIGDEKPIKRNVPTVPGFVIKEQGGDVEEEKEKWIALIEGHAQFSGQYAPHPFFGQLTREQVGRLDYKHIDHHLRQFNV